MGQLKYFITYYNNSKYDFKVKHNTHLTGLYTAERAAGIMIVTNVIMIVTDNYAGRK